MDIASSSPHPLYVLCRSTSPTLTGSLYHPLMPRQLVAIRTRKRVGKEPVHYLQSMCSSDRRRDVVPQPQSPHHLRRKHCRHMWRSLLHLRNYGCHLLLVVIESGQGIFLVFTDLPSWDIDASHGEGGTAVCGTWRVPHVTEQHGRPSVGVGTSTWITLLASES